MFFRKYGFLVAMLCSGICVADEQQAPESYKAGDRALSSEERSQLDEQRVADLPPQGAQETTAVKKSVAFYYQDPDASALYRLHPYAFYHPVVYQSWRDGLQLNDGSVWYVSAYDRHKVRSWSPNDPIFIKPDVYCCSPFYYVLQNRVTGDVVEVNLIEPPQYIGPVTYWVIDIDYMNGALILEDIGGNHTIWYVSVPEILHNWTYGDRLIIGVNNNWRSTFYPHVLINVHTLGYCEAKFDYLP